MEWGSAVMMRPLRNRSGFTIIEIIIATTVLAVVGSTIFAAFTSSAVLTKGQQHVAYNLARQSIENLYESVRGDWWDVPSEPLSLVDPGMQPSPLTLQGTKFTRSYTVNGANSIPIDINGDGEEDYRKVEITVQWS